MRIGCHEACACVTYCYKQTKNALKVTIYKLDEIRREPETLQKACLLAHSIFQGYNLYFQTNHLSSLITVLDGAESFDFYGFYRLPRYFIHPYVYERLDEEEILNDVEEILCQNWGKVLDQQVGYHDPEIRHFAQEQIEAFLIDMVENDLVFRTEEELRAALKSWVVNELTLSPKNNFDVNLIDFQNLKFNLQPIPLLERLSNASFIIVDISCVPDFLQEWNLIDLAPYTLLIGRIPVIGKLSKYPLDEWVRSWMCVGFLLQFLQGVNCLYQAGQNKEAATEAKWQIVASLTELAYNLAILKKKDLRIITALAFLAKLTGLMHFIFKPKSSFFKVMD